MRRTAKGRRHTLDDRDHHRDERDVVDDRGQECRQPKNNDAAQSEVIAGDSDELAGKDLQ